MTITKKRDWEGTSRRRVPRYVLQAPVDVTVVRSGMPNTVPGRSTDLGERGIAAVIAGELVPGETVDVEIKLSPTAEPLCMRALVRYQEELRCGLEFLAMTPEQRAVIREWVRDPNLEGHAAVPHPANLERAGAPGSGGRPAKRNRKWWPAAAIILVLLIAGALIFRWRWSRSWRQLEVGLHGVARVGVETPSMKVPAEEMQKRLIHRVDPTYPAEARDEGLEGIIAVDIVVGRDGSVQGVRALNGPDVLAKAAMDALRWWKFQPYQVNGEPVAVESTVAVEFKK